MVRVGVFLCHCGNNISDKIDFHSLKNNITDNDVVLIDENQHICSNDGQEMIIESIKSHKLDGVVVAACSPKIHEQKFMKCVEKADMNKYLMDIANIREQCAWIPKDPDPTQRALDIINSSINAVKTGVAHENIRLPITKTALIIGGGISGINAALSLANHNIKVYLIEKSATIGGNMVRIGKMFSADTMSEECAMCSLGPLIGEVAENPNIEVITLSEVTEVTGHAGNFTVNIETSPKLIDSDKCKSCGECGSVCNVETADEWNANLSMRKAVYRPFSGAMPSSYTIDENVCIKCGSCLNVCNADAIKLDNPSTKLTLNIGAIIVATGFEELKPMNMEEFGYNKLDGVVTQMELARILAVNGPTSGKLITPSTGKKPKRIVMVQCVGSRDRKPGSIPHCSTICCMVALKHANYIINHNKGTEVYICYTDMRTPGTYENYYFETQKKGEKSLRFIRGKVAQVKQINEHLMTARVEDTLGGGVTDIETDMVVLSCALKPSETIDQLQEATRIALTDEKFIKEKNPKMDPTQTTIPGIFVCGTAKGGMDVTESINMSRSAASRVSEMLIQKNMEIEPDFAVVDHKKCIECMKCIEICPSNAIYQDETIKIDPIACKGCGYCISKCEENAISLPLSSDDDIYSRIEGALGSGIPAIIAFLDKDIAYVAADNMGTNKVNYPTEVRIIKIPSILRLDIKHALYAFKHGAKGIFLGDGTANIAGNQVNGKMDEKVQELKKGIMEAGIEPERISFYKAYLPHYKGLATKLDDFSRDLALKNS